MKILLLQLIGKGGTQLYLSQLANAISNTDNEVSLLLGSHIYDEKQYADTNAQINLVSTNSSFKSMALKLCNPFTYYKILKIIAIERPDVVHLTFEDLISSILFCFLKIKGTKLLLTEHNPKPHTGDNIYSKLNQQLAKLIVRKVANKIIVHGDNIKTNLIENGVKRESISVIPHGDYSYYTKWSQNLMEEDCTILFFGLIKEYKGLEYLLRAIPLITPSIPNLKVIVAGDGDFSKYRKYINNEARFEIHNRYILDEEVAEFFERASIVVLPYTEASQSGIIPIAYAFKKPVVVTDVGSISEIVEDGVTGYIIPPKNTEYLAKSIIKILQNKNIKYDMGLKAYSKLENEMSWPLIAKKYIQEYKNIE
jgi:glycosyltransferase involved in cell wall biosynthesis